MDFAWLLDPHVWVALATLTALEMVLGIDNIVFIAILTGKLPLKQQPKARFIGLSMALIMRILLLFSLSWMMTLTSPLFTIPLVNHPLSGRDLILIAGGLFLIAKSTHEIHGSLEGEEKKSLKRIYPSFVSVIIQIMLLDLVFSLDSVITAIGMVDQLSIMVAAVIIAIIVMMFCAGTIGAFVENHPTVKMLALAFLLLIGVMLLAEGFHQNIPKGYIYFSMAFSVLVEMLNIRLRKKVKPVHLHSAYEGKKMNSEFGIPMQRGDVRRNE